MKQIVVKSLTITGLSNAEVEKLIETPKDSKLGDYAFPCFSLSKSLKKSPIEIAKDLASKIKSSKDFEKIEATGPYLNFFLNRKFLAQETLGKIIKEKDKYGSSNMGSKSTIVLDMSSPNIAKPFGIGHLRSTMIGNSISTIATFSGFKVVKLNYLGDWGTPFGKIIAGYKEIGDSKKLKENPIKHLYEIYTTVSKDEKYEEIGRNWFQKLEKGDKEALKLWTLFRDQSINDFERIYKILGVEFDVVSSESFFNKKMDSTINMLQSKGLLKESNGASIVDLSEYDLGVCLIKKSDGSTLYATRDITAAIYRTDNYKAEQLFYEVGSEQTLHFKQVFKVLELLGYKWATNCKHISHGLYLDKDGKKFATRKGKTIFMEDILDETISLAKQEILKRDKLSSKELDKRALAVARSAIIYGDLKNFRGQDAIFDIEKFLEFEGNTGPYLLYSYARARSILKKAKYKVTKLKIDRIEDKEKFLVNELGKFPEIVKHTYNNLSPNTLANYAYELAQMFNEFYHSQQVIGSDQEKFRLTLVDAFSQVLKNSLYLLGIPVLEKM